MKGHEPVSDAGLLFGSIFVAVSIVGIGILGGQQGNEQMAWVSTGAMVAAGAQTTPSCYQRDANVAANAAETECKSGCKYEVLPGSLFGNPNIVPSGTPDGKHNPALIFIHTASPGVSSGDATYQQWLCPEGKKIGDFAAANSALKAWLGSSYSMTPPSISPSTAVPTAGTVGSPIQSGLNANYAPGAVQTEVLPGSVNPQYTVNNLPTQQGTYPIFDSAGKPTGVLVDYTPGANAGAGEYKFWSPTNWNESIYSGPGDAGVSTAGSGTQTPGGYAASGPSTGAANPTIAPSVAGAAQGQLTNSGPDQVVYPHDSNYLRASDIPDTTTFCGGALGAGNCVSLQNSIVNSPGFVAPGAPGSPYNNAIGSNVAAGNPVVGGGSSWADIQANDEARAFRGNAILDGMKAAGSSLPAPESGALQDAMTSGSGPVQPPSVVSNDPAAQPHAVVDDPTELEKRLSEPMPTPETLSRAGNSNVTQGTSGGTVCYSPAPFIGCTLGGQVRGI